MKFTITKYVGTRLLKHGLAARAVTAAVLGCCALTSCGIFYSARKISGSIPPPSIPPLWIAPGGIVFGESRAVTVTFYYGPEHSGRWLHLDPSVEQIVAISFKQPGEPERSERFILDQGTVVASWNDKIDSHRLTLKFGATLTGLKTGRGIEYFIVKSDLFVVGQSEHQELTIKCSGDSEF